MSRTLFLAALFHVATSSSSGPAPTIFNLDRLDFLGTSPVPTPPPGRRGLNRLSPRQNADDERTCAYEDADYDDPVTCSVGNSCFYNTRQSWFGCCTNSACENKKTWCVPSSLATDLLTSSDTLYCDFGTATECYTWHNIETNRGITFTNYGCSEIEAIDEVWFHASSTPSTITPTSPTPTPPTDPSPTPTLPTSPSPPPPRETVFKKSVPVGAIAGGVIGGVVALAAIVVGIIFLIRRKKKTNAAAGTAYHGQPAFIYGPGQMPPSAPMSPQMGQMQPVNQYPPQNPQMGNYAPQGMQPTSPPMSPGPAGQAAPAYQPPNSPPQEHKHTYDSTVAQLP